jgi:hypothetical protein
MTKFERQLFWIGLQEKVLTIIAAMIPRKIVYWCGVRMVSHATTGKYSSQVVPELTIDQLFTRWENDSRPV